MRGCGRNALRDVLITAGRHEHVHMLNDGQNENYRLIEFFRSPRGFGIRATLDNQNIGCFLPLQALDEAALSILCFEQTAKALSNRLCSQSHTELLDFGLSIQDTHAETNLVAFDLCVSKNTLYPNGSPSVCGSSCRHRRLSTEGRQRTHADLSRSSIRPQVRCGRLGY
jgi:hypothetical protein